MSNVRDRKCFVISPIGAEGSPTRRHADTVFHCIIKPACKGGDFEDGIEYACERGDHKTAPGKITDQIYEDILEADLIVAVLTENNPNVYYELAIAQAAAKPVILLLEKGFDAPFDIKDHRIIYYDFDPQAIFHKVYVNLLHAAMTSLELKRGRHVVPFAPDLAPLGSPMHSIHARAADAEEETVRLLADAKKFFWLCGVTLGGWTINEDFQKLMIAAAKRFANGTHRESPIQVMIMSSQNPSLEPSMKSKDFFRSAAQSADVVQETWRSQLSELSCNAAFALNKKKALNYQIAMNEEAVVFIPYLTSRDTLRSPYIYAKRDSFYYDVIKEEFEFLWQEATKSEESSRAPKKPSSKKKSAG